MNVRVALCQRRKLCNKSSVKAETSVKIEASGELSEILHQHQETLHWSLEINLRLKAKTR